MHIYIHIIAQYFTCPNIKHFVRLLRRVRSDWCSKVADFMSFSRLSVLMSIRGLHPSPMSGFINDSMRENNRHKHCLWRLSKRVSVIFFISATVRYHIRNVSQIQCTYTMQVWVQIEHHINPTFFLSIKTHTNKPAHFIWALLAFIDHANKCIET